ncbi:MAG: hypothetical protein WCJ94_04700 [bacterium]
MKKIVTIVLCMMLFSVFSNAAKKSVKHVKKVKSVSTSLVTELKAAKMQIEQLNAVVVTLTAKAEASDLELQKIKNDTASTGSSVLLLEGICSLLTLLLILALISRNNAIKRANNKSLSRNTFYTHFEEIETNVLDKWKDTWYHPENINKELYNDVRNHFPELYENIEKWKVGINRRSVFVGHLLSLLSTKYPDIHGADSIYLLATEKDDVVVTQNRIIAGKVVCAQLKNDIPENQKIMTSYYEEVMAQFGGEFNEAKEVVTENEILKLEIEKQVEKIKKVRKIQGVCKFMSLSS